MTREEAINEIRSWAIPSEKGREVLETLIPELAESEDERIRKKCITIISKWTTKEDRDECIAYLEKQKDFQAKVEQRMEYLWDKLPDAHRVEEGNCTPEEWKALGAYMELEMNFDKGSEEEQKEQKPDTRDADDLQLLGFIYDLLNEIEWKDNWAMSKDECLRRLNNYRPQKPAEWSEEDEKLLDFWLDVIDRNDWRMDENFCKASREFINRLKSLRPHWKPGEEQDYSGLSDLERAIHRGFLCAGVENVHVAIIKETAKEVLVYAKEQLLSYADESNPAIEAMADLERTFECNPDKLPQWLKNKLAKKHLDGYTMGREDTMREMSDFLKSRFNSEKVKGPNPPAINIPTWNTPCYIGGPCTNPLKDCINCPRANMAISPNTASGTSTLKAKG